MKLEILPQAFSVCKVSDYGGVVADPSVLTDGQVDFGLLRPISFDGAGAAYRAYGDKIGDAFRAGAALK